MTIHAIATQLMTLFSPEERSIPDSADYPGRNGAVLLAMNGALQEVFGKSSPWVRHDERGAILKAAATGVSIAVTNGSTIATISEGTWQSWFSGCQIQIEGASVENRIKNASRVVDLKFPHDGPTGTTTATVWNTSVDLPSDVMEVVGEVLINGKRIPPFVSPNTQFTEQEDFGFNRHVDAGTDLRGAPCGYLVETWNPSGTAAPSYRLRLTAAPTVNSFLEYSAMIVPMVITDLASNDTLPIPLQWLQTIYYPVARQRLLACDFARGGGNPEEIGRSYQTALQLLASLNPRKASGTRMISRL